MFKTSEFVTSAVSLKQNPNKDNLNEYVFLGRSNVGKSSLINCLCNKKSLARVSSNPGKTITLNYYFIDSSFYLVDVPGYGFANRSKDMKALFGQYIDDYLTKNENIKMCFLLVDTKVGPTADDVLMYDYLKYLNLPITVVTTKCDKIGKTLYFRHEKNIKAKLVDANVIMTSTTSKYGIEKLKQLFEINTDLTNE